MKEPYYIHPHHLYNKISKTRGKRGFIAKEKCPVEQNVSDVHLREELLKELKKFALMYIIAFCLLILLLSLGMGKQILEVFIGAQPFNFTFIMNILLVLFLLFTSLGAPTISFLKYFKRKKINKRK